MSFDFFKKTDHLATESICKIPSFPNMTIWKEIINQSFKIVIWNNYFFKVGKHFKI